MKKILIISYFYPPSNFVGGERTNYWANNLNKFGYKPVIITRNWNDNQADIIDIVDKNETKKIISNIKEEHFLKHKNSLRDKLASLTFIRRILSFIQLFTKHVFFLNNTNKSFYKKARKIINEDKDFCCVIISGRPFENFAIGSKLSKKNGIPWIADYRDQWNTYPKNEQSILQTILSNYEKRKERAYLKSAHSFITTSSEWRLRIADFTNKKGTVILNGYKELKHFKSLNDSKNVVITYAGTLYPEQDIQAFLEVVAFYPNLIIRFIGTEVKPEIKNELNKFCSENKIKCEFIPRQSKDALDPYFKTSDILLLTSFEKVSGWLPVKCYEYYATGIPLLLYPNDNGVINNFIVNTNSGFTPKSKEELQNILSSCIKKKLNGESFGNNRNLAKGEFFSREHQTLLLAHLLNSIE